MYMRFEFVCEMWLDVEAGVLLDTLWCFGGINSSPDSLENTSKGTMMGVEKGGETQQLGMKLQGCCTPLWRALVLWPSLQLVTVSGAVSCFTSLDQWAVVLKKGLPKTACCSWRDFPAGTDGSSSEVPTAALILLKGEWRWAWVCSQG